jgi:hypothetical protein
MSAMSGEYFDHLVELGVAERARAHRPFMTQGERVRWINQLMVDAELVYSVIKIAIVISESWLQGNAGYALPQETIIAAAGYAKRESVNLALKILIRNRHLTRTQKNRCSVAVYTPILKAHAPVRLLRRRRGRLIAAHPVNPGPRKNLYPSPNVVLDKEAAG